ncbi:MAG: chromosomal replication initiator protein DnaA [Acidobacteriota bacterium]|jgi:chromosomal replication initiator protein
MDVWAQVLMRVGKRVNAQCFETWFRPIVFDHSDGQYLHLTVPNESFKKWLLENYSELLREAVREASRTPLQLKVSVGISPPSEPLPGPAPAPALEAQNAVFPLNPKYTFDSFVVGSSNQFARAAALAVAEQPSKAYNPLYIYGGVGLGKTHLMHAIGHSILSKSPRLRLTYMSSERFMNELVNSIRYDRTIQFREKYRNIDILLMDDIQFLAGKERTQEEFFHTFNALYDAQKQIVISSDCPPREIPTIEERLHSRFEWGLIADIQPPDLETKIAILRKKAEADLVSLPDSVAFYVASSIRSNIRELEGALIRLTARASLDGMDPSEIDIGYAKEVLKDLVTDDRRSVSSEMIIRAVASYFGLKPIQLKAKNNSRRIAQPRQIAMYICKQVTSLSLPQIGKDFGGKHHTTVLHSIRKIEEMRKKDSEIAAAVGKLMPPFR